MAFSLRSKVSGGTELAMKLKALGKAGRKAVKAGVGKAGSAVLKDARRRVPVELGLLKRSLARKVKVYPNGVAVAVIGPRAGFREKVLRSKGKWAPAPPPPSGYADPTKYTHLVEGGTARSARKEFIKPALDSQAGAVLAAIAQAVEAELAKAGV